MNPRHVAPPCAMRSVYGLSKWSCTQETPVPRFRTWRSQCLGHGLEKTPMSPGGGGGYGSVEAGERAGSVPTEGARRVTGIGNDPAAMGLGALAPGQRWSASRRRDVVLRLLRGERLDVVMREVGVEVYRLERWKTRAPELDLAGFSKVSRTCAPPSRSSSSATREAGLSYTTRGPRGARATPSCVAQTCVQETGCGTCDRPGYWHGA